MSQIMQCIVAMFLSLLSGIMIYMGTAMTFSDSSQSSEIPTLLILATLCGGFFATLPLLLMGTKSVIQVLMRGCLLGSLEWLAMIPVGLVMGGKAAMASGVNSEAEQAGAVIGGGIFAMLSGVFSIFMAVACLVGGLVFFLWGRGPSKQV